MKLPILLLSGLFAAAPLFAQSTLGDPTPVGGTQAGSAAGSIGSGSGAPINPREKARRKSHMDQLATCKKVARDSWPAGNKNRYAATERCQKAFDAQKATWYDKKKQAK
jgi:hypothetical protein